MLTLIMALGLSSCDVIEGVLGSLGIGDPCANGHTYSEEWESDGEKHWHKATCEHTDLKSDEAAHSYADGTCICGKTDPEATHEHTYSDTWSKNDTHHWHKATCEHTDLKADEAAHSYVGGACICGKAEPEAPHVHTFETEWSYDDTKHWHAATCEHVDEKSDAAGHNYVDGICVCGMIEPSASHTHTFSDEWSTDANKHWHAATCEHTGFRRDEGAHDYGTDFVCDTCGYTHIHTFDGAWSFDEDMHWHAPLCGHDVKIDFEPHTYVGGFCVCGAEAEHVHTFSGEWTSNSTSHWHAALCGHDVKADEGTHTYDDTYTCTACGYVHEHTYTEAWSYNDTHHWHEATCGHSVRGGEAEHFIGGDDACVGNCGYKYEAPHEHSYSASWSYDEEYHWHESNCEHKGLKADEGAHVFGADDTCTCGYKAPIVITSSDMSKGGWGYADKKSYSSSKPRIGLKELIPVKAGTVIKYDPKELQIYIDLPTTLTSNSSTASADGSTRAGWFNVPGEYVVQKDAYLGITVARPDGTTAIAPADYNCDITIYSPTTEFKMTYDKVNVYRFGGEGNDWCFVYLPEGYDPDRAEPYPFVIANHGNGWNMDGSARKANWTDNTMYMSAAEIARQSESKRDRFIATEDSSLWYSNPTIEALLAAGYIVCGAQNYGDNLYGNDDCTNACVAFFNHMTETYNVESTCHMIGASNGAMTTLNAAEKLGNKVSSVIIQYPLASIITHYLAGGHRDNIEAAYGLDTSKTYTQAELEAALSEYDVLYKNVVDGIKQGYYPAVKVYYSMTDTLTTANANAIPLINMLDKSGKEVVGVQVDADGVSKNHGHADHFDPEGYVAWFNAH